MALDALGSVLKKVFGSKNDREVKRLTPGVEKINSLEPKMQSLGDEELKELTPGFKARLAGGEGIDALLPEAFSAVREAAKRHLNMRHFDVQLIGGMVLHEGKISEMKTGEGKTLVATLPLYLNALTGKGCHLVTVNDYLAQRDACWMGPVYRALGLSVGIIQHDASFLFDPSFHGEDRKHPNMRPVARKEAYGADITYCTNNELGFDYLRDNMKFSLDDYVQRDLNFAIVDEVDSILIDEARTPLIISGQAEESTDRYYQIDGIVPFLKAETHYTVEEKDKQVLLTEEGVTKVEELLNVDNLYDPRHIETLHHVNQGLRSHVLFRKDVDYVVKDGEIIIVDEFTGRLMPGRRWSDGLHQAIEAKEKVKIESENQTLASITFQNYFRMYKKLAGMTGTAETEAGEFYSIYKLDVVVIPTNKPMIRLDNHDLVYKTKKEKRSAVIEEIKDCYGKGKPVLVGTISIEESERFSAELKKSGVPHHVLNAKQHEREAEIVAQAGRLKAVTISTNMAGRGTDIVLGGNPAFMAAAKAGKDAGAEDYAKAFSEASMVCEEEKKKVLELGGLYILGTERHESRRIDNQLRGRSGRQGDPGASRFYLSLDDDLMRIFGGERITAIMDRLGMEEGVPLEHSFISKAVENAQKKVEAHNFDIRKHLLEYDDVMNEQRRVVYDYRRQILSKDGVKGMTREFMEEAAEECVTSNVEEKARPENWDVNPVNESLLRQFGLRTEDSEIKGLLDRDALVSLVKTKVMGFYDEKALRLGIDVFSHVEKVILLHTLDALWKDHLLSMDHLKGGIGLRGYAQKNPLTEYKKEGFELFAAMIAGLKTDSLERVFKVEVKKEEALPQIAEKPKEQKVTLSRGEAVSETSKPAPVKGGMRVGRNDPCPCGSGQKYKKCCGK